MTLSANEVWTRILDRARRELPEQTFRTWLEPTEPLALEGDTIIIGSPDQFAADCERLGKASIDLRRLAPQLRLEFQYVIQSGADTGTARISPTAVTIAARYAHEAEVISLLDRSAEQWRRVAGDPQPTGGKYGRSIAFLVSARDAVEALRDGTGWDSEYSRDIWRLSRIPGLTLTAGQTREHAHLRFDRITQPWLRELAKRWIRLRLSSGRNVENHRRQPAGPHPVQ